MYCKYKEVHYSKIDWHKSQHLSWNREDIALCLAYCYFLCLSTVTLLMPVVQLSPLDHFPKSNQNVRAKSTKSLALTGIQLHPGPRGKEYFHVLWNGRSFCPLHTSLASECCTCLSLLMSRFLHPSNPHLRGCEKQAGFNSTLIQKFAT